MMTDEWDLLGIQLATERDQMYRKFVRHCRRWRWFLWLALIWNAYYVVQNLLIGWWWMSPVSALAVVVVARSIRRNRREQTRWETEIKIQLPKGEPQ